MGILFLKGRLERSVFLQVIEVPRESIPEVLRKVCHHDRQYHPLIVRVPPELVMADAG